MSTPRKPGEPDRGDQPDRSDGPAESNESAEPRAAQRPGAPAGSEPVAGPAGPGKGPEPQKPVAQTPPWQRGQQQRSPQANANRPGGPAGGPTSPAGPAQPAGPAVNGAGKPPATTRPVVTGTAAPKPPVQADKPAKPAKPVVTGTAAPKPPVSGPAGSSGKDAAKAAARAKAAVIDGPTRNIARTDLAKDMPDLSAVKHPTPAEAPAPGGLRQAAASALTVSPPVDGVGLRATVQLRRVDPWSTLKVSLIISVALFFVWMVAVGLLYVVLDGMGVWDRLNNAFTEMVTDTSGGGLVTSGQVFGYSALVGLMNVVLFTALATIGSFIYNLCSDLVGGVQVTLADPD